MYLTRPGDEYVVPLGDYLGDMTDELGGDYIEEFVSLGPKQYAYRCAGSKKHCCKIRGFTLNSKNARKLNFDTMKEMALNYLETRVTDKITVSGPQIARKPNRTVVTQTYKKTYRCVYDKCRVMPNGDTLPFGY